MKNLIKKFIATVLVFSTFTVVSACGKEKSKEYSNEELSVIYKDIAVSAWEKIGVEDPTVTTAALSSVPDKKEETSDVGQIANIMSNANSMAGLIYMVSLLYGDENFKTTDNIAVFDVSVTMFGQTYTQSYKLATSIDVDDDKLYLEAAITTMGNVQYSNVEVDYDFDKNELKSYRFYSNVLSAYVDMSLTEDNKYLWYETETATDDFAIAVASKKQEFLDRAAEITKLEANFDSVMQAYMTVLEKAIEDLA